MAGTGCANRGGCANPTAKRRSGAGKKDPDVTRDTAGMIAPTGKGVAHAAALPGAESGAKARPKPDAKPRAKSATKPANPTPERPRGGPARPIFELMPEIGRSAFRRFGFVQSSVVTRWAEIVGADQARVTCPEAIRFPPGERSDGILQVLVEPAHAPLVNHMAPEIIERVNRFFGYNAVARVKLRQGRVQPRPDTSLRAAPPMLKPVPVELGDSLRDIGDPELRAVLESLARNLSQPEGSDT